MNEDQLTRLIWAMGWYAGAGRGTSVASHYAEKMLIDYKNMLKREKETQLTNKGNQND